MEFGFNDVQELTLNICNFGKGPDAVSHAVEVGLFENNTRHDSHGLHVVFDQSNAIRVHLTFEVDRGTVAQHCLQTRSQRRPTVFEHSSDDLLSQPITEQDLVVNEW